MVMVNRDKALLVVRKVNPKYCWKISVGKAWKKYANENKKQKSPLQIPMGLTLCWEDQDVHQILSLPNFNIIISLIRQVGEKSNALHPL